MLARLCCFCWSLSASEGERERLRVLSASGMVNVGFSVSQRPQGGGGEACEGGRGEELGTGSRAMGSEGKAVEVVRGTWEGRRHCARCGRHTLDTDGDDDGGCELAGENDDDEGWVGSGHCAVAS